MNSGKIRFVLVLSAFLLLFSFTSCSKSSGKKCVEDKECGYGAYCSVEEGKEKGKCADFAEGDYKIEITSLEDGAHVCGKITVEVALSEVSEKLHDGMEAALTVAKDRDMQTLTGAFSENAISFEIDLAEKGEYKLAAFLIQNPYFRAEVTLTCDSEPEPEDDTDTNTPDEDNTEPVDDGDTDTPVDDADSESVDDDADTDTEPEEATPVATITSHPQDVSSVATAEFTFESDIEEATFRCKLDANEWESCTSPKVYENLTEGDHKFSLKAVNVGGTESEVVSFSWKIDFTIANIEILAPWNSDKAGNGDADTCKANNYGAIVKDGTIYVGTTQDALDGKNYGVCFKVGVKNTVVNAKFEVYSKNGETWNPLFTGKIEDGEIENGVMLNGLALSEGANTLKVVVGGKSEDVPDAEYVQKIVVATESPAISWAFPPKDHKFLQSNFSSGIFATFNITGSIPGLEIELVEGDSTVASLKTGKLGAESLSFVNPELADSCSPRDFHVVIYDTLNDNTVDSDSRSITFDVNAPSIDSLSVFGKNGIAVHSTVSAAQNPIIVNVNVSDAANTAGDGSREVTLYTNNGS